MSALAEQIREAEADYDRALALLSDAVGRLRSLGHQAVALQLVEPEPRPEASPEATPVEHEPERVPAVQLADVPLADGDGALFGRGSFTEHITVEGAATIEHSHLPQAARRERATTLTLSFDSAEERDQLIEELDVRITRRGAGAWACSWPAGADDPVLSLDFEDAA